MRCLSPQKAIVAANFAAREQLRRLVVHNCPAKPYLVEGWQIQNRPFWGARIKTEAEEEIPRLRLNRYPVHFYFRPKSGTHCLRRGNVTDRGDNFRPIIEKTLCLLIGD